MKTKTTLLYVCIAAVCISFSKTSIAQQSRLRMMPQNQQQMQQMAAGGKLTAKVFMASNKAYGYDIVSNDRLIFHQPAFFKTSGNNTATLTQEEQAKLAARISIEKINRKQNPALTNEEVQKVLTHSFTN